MWVRALLLSALFALGLGASAGQAASYQAHGYQRAWAPVRVDGAQATPVQQRMLSLPDVVQMVRRQYGGDLISARLEQGGGRPFYVLRWRLPNDSVEDIRVDAVSGAISR